MFELALIFTVNESGLSKGRQHCLFPKSVYGIVCLDVSACKGYRVVGGR